MVRIKQLFVLLIAISTFFLIACTYITPEIRVNRTIPPAAEFNPSEFSDWDNLCIFKVQPFNPPLRPLPKGNYISGIFRNGSIYASFSASLYNASQKVPYTTIYMQDKCNEDLTIGISKKSGLQETVLYDKDANNRIIKRILLCIKDQSIPAGWLSEYFGESQMSSQECRFEWIDNMCCKEWFIA